MHIFRHIQKIKYSKSFNITLEDKIVQLFSDSFNLEHLIKKLTCFKGSPSWIDHIIINRKLYFKSTRILETGTSDLHKLTAVSFKLFQILKATPNRNLYTEYEAFDESSYKNDLKSKIYSIVNLVYS